MTRRTILGLVLVSVGLPVAAISFGLVIAAQTARMSPKPEGSEARFVEILVASKELAPGTRFTKDSLQDLVTRKKCKPDEVPDNAVIAEEDLVGKQLVKALRADDHIGFGDLGTYKHQPPLKDLSLISVRFEVDETTPFAKPGSRIDIIGTGVTRANKVVRLLVLPNVLVMAEEIICGPPGSGASSGPKTQRLTLAVTTEEALLIRMCETANTVLR